jgi:hypothetical protein
MALALLGVMLPAGALASGAQRGDGTTRPDRTKPGPRPNPYHGSVLYTGRGEEIKKASFRLKGDKLIEATIVVIERCTKTGEGRRRYHWRAERKNASPRWPLRVDGQGRFHVSSSEVAESSDWSEEFVGKVTPRSIVGTFASESSESPAESGIVNTCQTGAFPPRPMKTLSFHARRRGTATAPPASRRGELTGRKSSARDRVL